MIVVPLVFLSNGGSRRFAKIFATACASELSQSRTSCSIGSGNPVGLPAIGQ